MLTFLYGNLFRYEEHDLELEKIKTNVMFIGDSKGQTIIT